MASHQLIALQPWKSEAEMGLQELHGHIRSVGSRENVAPYVFSLFPLSKPGLASFNFSVLFPSISVSVSLSSLTCLPPSLPSLAAKSSLQLLSLTAPVGTSS